MYSLDLQETDPVARVWDREMFVVIEMNVSEEPRVSKLSAGAVKPLRAAQMAACRGQERVLLPNENQHI